MTRSSTIEELPPEHEVFMSFFELDLRYGFVSDLITALESNNINVFIDDKEVKGKQQKAVLKRIDESRIALVFLSMSYTQSVWCLEKLTKIMDCMEQRKLVAIPIFYKLEPDTVSSLKGQFGDSFRNLRESDVTKKNKWEQDLIWISNIQEGVTVPNRSSEGEKIIEIVKAVEKVLKEDPSEASQKAYVDLYDSQTLDLRYGFVSVNALERFIYRNQPGIIIGCLLILFFILLQMISLIYPGGAIYGNVENVQGVQEYIPTEITKNPIDKYSEFPICEVGAKPGSSTLDTKTNDDFLDRTFTNSPVDSKVKPPQIQVFINFRGEQLRNNFIGYLVDALRRNEINVFIDNHALRGENLNSLFKRIEESGIAIVVFSSRYTESKWCLEELVKIKERVDQDMLKVLPIFYKVTTDDVKNLNGDFGRHFRNIEYTYRYDEAKIKQWKEAIAFVSGIFGRTLDEKSNVLEIDFVEIMVKDVLKMLLAISTVESREASR